MHITWYCHYMSLYFKIAILHVCYSLLYFITLYLEESAQLDVRRPLVPIACKSVALKDYAFHSGALNPKP